MSVGPEPAPSMSWAHGGDREELAERLLGQRVVLLGGPLDDAAAGDLITRFLLLASADPVSEIRLYVNSPGGPSPPFLSLYDALQVLSAPVATICMSQAKGTAALLVAAGASGKRLAFAHSTILLKLPEERLDGLEHIDAQVREARRRRESLADIAARHSGRRERDVIASDLEHGMLMSPDEAKAYGIVDAVIEPGHPYFVRFPLPPSPGGNGG